MQIKSKFCPVLKSECVETKCAWFISLQGKNPQTGQDISEFGCAVSWLPILLVENSQQQRQSGAAIESFRNEMIKLNLASLKLELNKMQAIEGNG